MKNTNMESFLMQKSSLDESLKLFPLYLDTVFYLVTYNRFSGM